MFSDADPVVALDPKQQQRELTKPSIYTGIPVAVSCLKNKQYPMHRPHLPGKHTTASVFCVWQKKKILSNAIFLGMKAATVCSAALAVWSHL